jgi:hypothetical protein
MTPPQAAQLLGKERFQVFVARLVSEVLETIAVNNPDQRIRTSTDGVRVRTGCLIFHEIFPNRSRIQRKKIKRIAQFSQLHWSLLPTWHTIEVADAVGVQRLCTDDKPTTAMARSRKSHASN